MAIDKKWFLQRLADRQLSQRKLARLMDVDASAITHVLNGKRRLQLTEAQRLARFLGVNTEDVLSHAGLKLKAHKAITSSVIGMVDEDGLIRPLNGLSVESPSAHLSCLRVQAGLSALDGVLLFFDPSQMHAADLLLGKLCILKQHDVDRVGIPKRSLTPGRYTISLIASEMHDQVILQASPVLWIKP